MRMRLRLHWAAHRQKSFSEYQKSDGFITITGDPFSSDFTDTIYEEIQNLKGWKNEQWLITSLTVIASEPDPHG